MEKYSLRYYYTRKELEDNFLYFIYNLSTWSNPKDGQNEANSIAQISYKKIDLLLDNDMEDYALLELKKILPEII